MANRDSGVVVSVAPRPWGRLVSLSSAGGIRDLVSNEFSIGRESECNFVLRVENRVVSRLHCIFRREPGETSKDDVVFLEDKSTNGTCVNNNKVGKGNRCLLSNGMEITVCPADGSQEKIAFYYQHLSSEDEMELENGGPQRQYSLRYILGSGEFGTVRLAIHRGTGGRYAIKAIDKRKSRMNGSHNEEVNALMKLDHPNIVGIKEMFDTAKTLYLVSELATGGELLDQLLEVRRYTEGQARSIFGQMLDAVEYLHEQGIAHQALKLENILLKSKTDHSIKLSNFGMSRIIGEHTFMKSLTPQYMAPEVLKNSEIQDSIAGDMWSLGVILYILLSGNPPFEITKYQSQVMAGQVNFPPDDPWATVSAKHLIRGLMVVDPQKRLTAKQAKQHPWVTGFPPDLDAAGTGMLSSASSNSPSGTADPTTSTTATTPLKQEEREPRQQRIQRLQELQHLLVHELVQQEVEVESKAQELQEKERKLAERETWLNSKGREWEHQQQQQQSKAEELEEKERKLYDRTRQLDEKLHDIERIEGELEVKARGMEAEIKQQIQDNINASVSIYSLREVRNATEQFSVNNRLGRGEFGSVYRGALRSIEVAIKKKGGQGDSEFLQEIAILALFKHSSIVPLIGVCFESEERCLIYRFMKGGPLEDRLCLESSAPLLWKKRITIARQASEGLAFLHEGSSKEENPRSTALHGDINSGNILLDESDNARVSYGGNSRSREQSDVDMASIQAQDMMPRSEVGTPGYVDPHSAVCLDYTAASDVFGFGVVLLELLTGSRAVIPGTPPILLYESMKKHLRGTQKQPASVHADPRAGEWPPTVATRLADLALRCLEEAQDERPTSTEVAQQLRDLEAEVSAGIHTRECVVCMTNPRGCIFFPCHHSLVCIDCGQELLRRKLKCPNCRSVINEIVEGTFTSTFVPGLKFPPSTPNT